jgi:protein-L-isoaspartate O-methyltransferase
MEVLRSIEALDAKLAECDAAERISDDAMRAMFGSFRMELEAGPERDPFAPAWRDQQLALYRRIVGQDYATSAEVTAFDIDAATIRPFPFTTRSSATTGEYFMAIGFVLQAMALPPGSRVLEFGPGWGFTSLWLAQLGHHVTTVDIEPHFCELIRRRAARESVSIDVVNADFFWAETCERQFDAVLFYDCFHHCDDHIRLLTALRRIVAPQGRVFFGAEPIIPDFPIPWGLRLDGWSLWGIRKHGWMELGFRDDYFAHALARTGWFGRKISAPGVDRLRVWEARRREDATFSYAGDDPRLRTQIGRQADGVLALDADAKGTGLFGPYLDLPAGRYAARLHARDAAGSADMDVVADVGNTSLARRRVDARDAQPWELVFTTDRDVRGVEVRLFCPKGFQARISRLEIVPLGG